MDSSHNIGKNEELDSDSENYSSNNYSHSSECYNGIENVESDSRCVSESEEIFEMFSKGVTENDFNEFCELFSKKVFKSNSESCYTENKSGDEIGTDLNYSDEKFYEYSYSDPESQELLWESLEWFVNVLEELNQFQSLGFGVTFLMSKLKVLVEKVKENESPKVSQNLEYSKNMENIRRWIDFINVFRDANNSIYTTYTLLEIMEMKLAHIKCKLIRMLQLKQSNKWKLMGASMGMSSPRSSSQDHVENTPINTPSSTTTVSSDKGDDGILCEIWDEQLKKMQLLVFNKFRHYLINVIEQLRQLYPSCNYYQMIQFIVYSDLKVQVIGGDDAGNTNGDSDVSNFNDGNDDIKNDINEVYKDTEEILKNLEKYYSSRNMNEEKVESYVKRIVDLNRRLIPKFVKINSKLPIYYEGYLNALVCNNIQDGVFQLISSNEQGNYKEGHKEKENYSEEGLEYKSWMQKISVVKLLSKTNLEVVDVVRCSFNGERKLVVFTQGSMRDLFSTSGSMGGSSYKDYKETYKELYRDSIIIKNDKEQGAEGDDEISSSIYFCTDNLNEVANREIEKVMISMLPNFNWYPKFMKYQHNYQSRQTDHNYRTEYEFENIDEEVREGAGTDYIEYKSLEEKIWSNRLNMFNSVNERNIRNMLLGRNNNLAKRVEYESTNLLVNNKVPFKVLLDYNNYIPIKYTYNEPDSSKEECEKGNGRSNSSGTSGTSGDSDNKKNNADDDNDWIIRLFNSNTNKIFKSRCIDIEVESDLFPGFYLFNNYKLNCFILPIHEKRFQTQETFQNFSKMVQNKIDLIYPPYLQQVNKIMSDSSNGNSCNSGNSSKDELGGKFTGNYGDFFTTYHTNLIVGSKDKMIINLVFHLVCCDTSMDDDVNPIEYAEDTEVILNHVKKMEPVFNGLSRILATCSRRNIQTIHLPASLKCCYKVNQYNSSAIQGDFQAHATSRGSHLNTQLSLGTGAGSKEGVLECNHDYVRCLAVVSHLASLLNKNKCAVNNINLIFPQHLKRTLLPKTAANIFTTRVNMF
ncbi:conserved hypothetical protein [Theileria orientalis strain Shintoku]|uniref:Uncharacterized protein n=1 Tax=Theileria orientalis strain Shintoku TaxID=869250 RepID=J4C9A1_THEOR|nr:conserved hypothetical protein [Theileria orientalis strain Shintoku]BAM42178.1 conserved hypothetical protein [Theileria orientalis strain Shintoku]|eukprot:XP_009692479.1 conserved hypothetical protein [Theileria orientalis strain Shintoku]